MQKQKQGILCQILPSVPIGANLQWLKAGQSNETSGLENGSCTNVWQVTLLVWTATPDSTCLCSTHRSDRLHYSWNTVWSVATSEPVNDTDCWRRTRHSAETQRTHQLSWYSGRHSLHYWRSVDDPCYANQLKTVRSPADLDPIKHTVLWVSLLWVRPETDISIASVVLCTAQPCVQHRPTVLFCS